MSGAGYRIFADEEILFAEDLMLYLMQQVATVFDNSTQRNSSITSPTEGMLSYTRDDDTLRFYNGTIWLPVANPGTITGVTVGAGLTGGGSSGSVSIAVDSAQNIRTLTAGSGLVGNSTVGNVTLNVRSNAKGDILAGRGVNDVEPLPVGSNNQRLVANSATTTGLTWASDSQNTVVTAKGDLLAGTASSTVGRLAAGTANFVLTPDSSTATGLKWVRVGEIPIMPTSLTGFSKTLELNDAGKLLIMTGTNVTVTVPANASVAFPVGTQVNVMQQGSGPVTIQAASGVTIQVTPGLRLRTQFSVATLVKIDTNTWVTFGDLVV
jgi:hypothetical protein